MRIPKFLYPYISIGVLVLVAILFVGWRTYGPQVKIARDVASANTLVDCSVNGVLTKISVNLNDSVTYKTNLYAATPLSYKWTLPSSAQIATGCANNNYCTVKYIKSGINQYASVAVTGTNGVVYGTGCPYVDVSTTATSNTPPTVDAGTDQTTTVSLPTNPVTVTLRGTGGDDGLPNPPGKVTYTWSQVSGPSVSALASSSSGSPDSPIAYVSFNTAGTYVIRLTASDGQLSNYDDVTVYVYTSLVNKPPTVSGGPNQSIRPSSLPFTVTLPFTATDDGLPNPPSKLTYVYSKASGPSGGYFGNSGGTETFTFNSVGTYVLGLTANDSLLSGGSTVTYNVLSNTNLTVSSFSVTDTNGATVTTLVAGRTYRMKAIITNTGANTTPITSTRFCTNYSMTKCPTAPLASDLTSPIFVYNTAIPSLTPGASATVNVGIIPESGSVSYFIATCVDPANVITEFNEGDNCKGFFVPVQEETLSDCIIVNPSSKRYTYDIVQYSAIPKAGIPPYSYSWHFGDALVLGGCYNSSVCSVGYPYAGTAFASVGITDSKNKQLGANCPTVQVYPRPFSCTVSNLTPKVYQTVDYTLTSPLLWGLSPYTYNWSLSSLSIKYAPPCLAGSTECSVSYNYGGYQTASVSVKDTNGQILQAICQPVTVQAPPNMVSCGAYDPHGATITTAKVGEPVFYSMAINFGRGPFNFKWSIPGCTGSYCNVIYDNSGSKTAVITATDAAGVQGSASCPTVTVSP